MIDNDFRNLFVSDDDVDYDEYDEYYDEDSIDGLGFSVRTNNCLKRAGITTISQLKQMTVVDLKKVRNLGSGSLQEIMQKVELFGADNRTPQDVWLPSKFGIK